eukprot:2284890-Prymnesium_polylepis.1
MHAPGMYLRDADTLTRTGTVWSEDCHRSNPSDSAAGTSAYSATMRPEKPAAVVGDQSVSRMRGRTSCQALHMASGPGTRSQNDHTPVQVASLTVGMSCQAGPPRAPRRRRRR